MKEKTGILLPEVVLLADVKYRKIPGYVGAYAGENGKIILIRSDGLVKIPTEFEWKTTKGTYKYVKAVSDDFVQVTKAVHQLVCLAFHGNPPEDGRIYEPNHKNGNKHDNRADNLEWSNRSSNIQHAYDNGLCQQGIRIELIDVINSEVKQFNSLSSLSRHLGLSRYELRDIAAKHRNVPYQGQYLFIVDDSSDKKINRHQSRPVMFKDYVTGIISITDSSIDASVKTGVKSGTITLRTSDRCSLETQNKLLSKYVFKPLSDNPEWPVYTKEQALESEKIYHQR